MSQPLQDTQDDPLELILSIDSDIPMGDFPWDVLLHDLHLWCDEYFPYHPYSGPLCFSLTEYLHPCHTHPEDRFNITRFYFKGDLTSSTDRTFTKSVVCKLELATPAATSETYLRRRPTLGLHNEASKYCEELRDLQGVCIPEFYGYFKGSTLRGKGSVSCLLTQYHGQDIQNLPGVWSSWIVREGLLNALNVIHHRGIIHDDILNGSEEWGKNIIVEAMSDKYRVFIIDFEDARMHGPCRGAPPTYSLGPEKPGDACRELYKFGLSAGIYAPWGIYCDNAVIPLHKARSWEELHKSRYVDMVPPYHGPNDRIARKAWEKYMSKYGCIRGVREVIQTLNKAPESRDATEDNKQSDASGGES